MPSDRSPDDGSFMAFDLDDGRRVEAQALFYGTRRQRWRVEVFGPTAALVDGRRVVLVRAQEDRLEAALAAAGVPDGPTMLDQQLRRLRRMLEADDAR